MLPPTPSSILPATSATALGVRECVQASPPAAKPAKSFRFWSRRGLTLVEVMVSMTVLAVTMLGFITTFMQSRRTTESSVLQAAATAMMYGLIEQIKQLDYTTLVPNGATDDPDAVDINGVAIAPPFIRVRINQEKISYLRCVYTPVTDEDITTTTIPAPQGPATTPAAGATAASVGAIDNFIGAIPLSTVTGTVSQQINLNIWVWIDGIPDLTRDVSEVKKITIVYTYSYQDGSITRGVRNREVFLRSRYDQ